MAGIFFRVAMMYMTFPPKKLLLTENTTQDGNPICTLIVMCHQFWFTHSAKSFSGPYFALKIHSPCVVPSVGANVSDTIHQNLPHFPFFLFHMLVA